jgi:hypothetical protein
MTEQRLLEMLDDWAGWMHSYAIKLGYPSRSLILQGGGAEFGQGFDIMCDEVDEKNCIALDAAIDSLTKPQQQAINARYLHSNKPILYEHHLMNAIDALIVLCMKKNIY